MNYMKRLMEHYEKAKECVPEDKIIGIFLRGSQNYGLDDENSDVDSVVLAVGVEGSRIKLDEECIDIYNVEAFWFYFYTCNPNYIEILWSKAKYINPKYAEVWDIMESNREKIYRRDPLRTHKKIVSMICERASQQRTPKQVSHIVRLYYLLMDYAGGGCDIGLEKLSSSDRFRILNIKRGKKT